MELFFCYNGVDYECCIHEFENGEYEVDVVHVGTYDMNVGSDVQRYAEDLIDKKLKENKNV